MTRVVRFHQIGEPDVLQIDDIEVPAPGADEVQIRVKALGLNRAESMFRRGVYIDVPQFPQGLGYEAAGIVEAVGAQVEDFALGEEVSVIPSLSMAKWPAYGELANFPAFTVVRHPTSLSLEEAAATWMQYVTAYGGLVDVPGLAKGEFVVITAATGGVGVAAIQVANMLGAIPIATTRSAAKKQALLDLGAAHVVVTDEEDLGARVREITDEAGVRVVFDPVAGPDFQVLGELLTHGGFLIAYGALSPEPTPFPLFPALVKSLNVRGFIYSEIVEDPRKLAAAKAFILDGLTSGDLKPIIDRRFDFEAIVEAHRYLESNAQMGKVVVTLT